MKNVAFCYNYRLVRRHLRRGAVRKLLIAIVVIQMLLGVFEGYVWWENKRQEARLEKRANIIVTLVDSAERRGVFTEREKQVIWDSWQDAQFHLVEPEPFKGYPNENTEKQ